MIYPRKTPKQAKLDFEAKKQETLKQREQLKSLLAQQFKSFSSPVPTPQHVKEKVQSFFEPQQTISSKIKTKDIHSYVAPIDQELPSTIRNQEQEEYNKEQERPDSRMSGATESFVQEEEFDHRTGRTKKSTVINSLPVSPLRQPGPKLYDNEEEEWSAFYKSNHNAYLLELQGKKDKKALDMVRYKQELDQQIHEKKDKKAQYNELKRLEHEHLMRKVQKEEEKEKKKKAALDSLLHEEKISIQKQIKDNKMRKQLDIKNQKEFDHYMVAKIREEHLEKEKAVEEKRKEDYNHYRKMLKQNDIKRQEILQQKELEKKQEIQQIELYNRLVEAREKKRADDIKAKDNRLYKSIEAARQYLGNSMVSDRDAVQESKIKEWIGIRDREEAEEQARKKIEAQQLKVETNAFYAQQVSEKKKREKSFMDDRNDQARLWKETHEKYLQAQMKKEDEKKKQLEIYNEVIKKQMNEKLEQRKANDRLFQLRVSQNRRTIDH